MTTINAQIKNAYANTNEGQYEEATAQIEALLAHKLTKKQRERVEAIAYALKELAPTHTMSNQLAKYRARYQTSITASGNKSLSNGDKLAVYLERKTAKEVCEIADKWTPIKGGQTHWERYANLNPGQKRMNSGNKLRAAIKRETLAVDEKGLKAA